MEKDFKIKLIGVTENPQLLSVIGVLRHFGEKSSAELMEELSRLSVSRQLLSAVESLDCSDKKSLAKLMEALCRLSANPQLLSTAGALGCFEEKSSAELMEELSCLSEEEREEKERAVLKNSFGRGHGSVGDQNSFVFSVENLPRAATLQICQPHYLAHLQQSLRRSKASRGFHLPEAVRNSPYREETERILYKTFELYKEMSKAGVPDEDARYILPLYTRTHIQTLGNARELCHLWKMTHSPKTEVPSIVRAVIDEMIEEAKKTAPLLFEDFKFNYETLAWCPSAQLYASSNEPLSEMIATKGQKDKVSLIGFDDRRFLSEASIEKVIQERNEAELSNLKHIHFDFLAPMSLACFHQAIRQRTWDHAIESIYRAADCDADSRMIVPPKIEQSDFDPQFRELHLEIWSLYRKLLKGGIARCEAIGIMPHSLKIYDWIHINGWNALHSIGKRTCTEAQGEIMGIARQIAKYVKEKAPVLGKWSEPQCVIYGYCPENKDCGYYKKFKKNTD